MCLEESCKADTYYNQGDVLKIDGDPNYLKGWIKLNKRQCEEKIEINENTIIDIDTPDGPYSSGTFTDNGHLPTEVSNTDSVGNYNTPTQDEKNRDTSSFSENSDIDDQVLIKMKTARDNGIITQDEFQKLLERYFFNDQSNSNNNQTNKEITDAIEGVDNTLKTIKQIEIGACILNGKILNIMECLF